ncbi:MAG: hypothetical protein BroJett025_08500 [Patescibacteria group bacterium]|nr:MAG: hypothetical protein BroJett025_08500 [Patescibacteria group bacterium]
MEKNMKSYNTQQSGMALVTVLIFSAIAMVVIVTSISLTTITSQSSRTFLQGQRALHVAESGAENALMRLIRDPTYTQEELTIDDGTARIVVSGTSPRIVTVTGEVGNSVRQVEVQVSDQNGIMTVTSWKELF